MIRLLHELKAPEPSDFNPLGRSSDFKFTHAAKADTPRLVTESGISISSSELQALNAESGIASRFGGRITSVKPLHPEKTE